MASVKFKNIDGVQKLVVEKFTQLKNEERTLVEVAEFAKTRIQQETRLGKSMVTGRRLKPLSQAYINRRRTDVDVDSQFFSPARSNLTRTGQMLDSLKSRIVKTPRSVKEPSSVEVFPAGQRNDGYTNQEVAQFAADGGRPFLGLDKRAIRQMRNIVLKNLRRLLRQTF